MAATPLTADLNPLLTEYVIKKLKKNHLTSVYSFVRVDAEQLAKITNLPIKDIATLKNELIERFAGRCCSGESEGIKTPLSTGIPSVDTLLQGGLLPGHVYEFCGESGSGKTQLCMTIAANIAMRYCCSVFYIDTKCDFSGTKIQHILDSGRDALTEQELGHTMARIKVERVFSPDLLVQTVEELAGGMHFEEDTGPKLLVIDSLPALWYLFQDAKSSCEPLGPLTKLICALRKLAVQYSVAIVLVNLAIRMVEGMSGGTNEAKRKLCPNGNYPALGRFWESAPGTRLLLQAESDESSTRSVTVWKSNYIRSGDRTVIRITDGGVR